MVSTAPTISRAQTLAAKWPVQRYAAAAATATGTTATEYIGGLMHIHQSLSLETSGSPGCRSPGSCGTLALPRAGALAAAEQREGAGLAGSQACQRCRRLQSLDLSAALRRRHATARCRKQAASPGMPRAALAAMVNRPRAVAMRARLRS